MAIRHLLQPHQKDLGGGFLVRRLLPSAARQAVGPFLFFDHFGPVVQRPGENTDVRPHPHIGLATVTYLFEGAMVHRDSLGVVQRIEPGAINWMTAGRGIVHSERTPEELRNRERPLHGLQLWAGLPREHEEAAPAFVHTPAGALPVIMTSGARIRVLIGEFEGVRSPVATFATTTYLDIAADAGATLALPADGLERAVYGVEGRVAIDGATIEPGALATLDPAMTARVALPDGGRAVVIGGAPLDGHRHMWWNFVSTRRERIEAAKADWSAQRFASVPGETEFIPLPER